MHKKTLPGASIIIFVAAVIGFGISILGAQSHVADAQTATANVYGYAWASNIGWISFNCSNTGTCGTVPYGVNVSTSTGDVTGYAWSSGIGWISFNETSGCPSGTCAPKLLDVSPTNQKGDKQLTGWAKAVIGGTSAAGGWDGWIKLDHNKNDPVTYNFQSQQFTGYAWGSDVIGWISFNSQNQGSDPAYSVKGPAGNVVVDDIYTLGNIVTSSKCDATNATYLEVSVPANGNVGPDYTYSGFYITSGGIQTALPAGALYDAQTRIVFKHYVSTTSPAYKYVVYANRTSTGQSTSTATSTLVGLASGFSCATNANPSTFKFTSKSFILNPDTVHTGDHCVAFMDYTHSGTIDAQVSVACTLTSQPAAAIDLGYQLSSTRNVNPGLHTFSCTMSSSTNPSTVYDSFSITRRCFNASNVQEI